MTSWLDDEVEGCRFGDGRLGKRFRILLERLSKGLGETIPMACQDWASTKAAYRFFANQRVSERFFPAIFWRRGLASESQGDGFWCCTIQPNFLFREKILSR
jgi:hypothetical protein